MSTVIASMEVSPGLPILQDHFPSNPVVPAFVLLRWVRSEIAKNFFVQQEAFLFTNVKFLKPVLPGNIITLSTQQIASSIFKFNILSNETTLIKGELRSGNPQ